MSSLIGQRLGRYQIDSLLGVGGMAEVYLATDTQLGRTVAVKRALPSIAEVPELAKRFLQEARLVAALEHPNIVPIYDIGAQDGVPFLVMPYLECGTLADRQDGGPLAASEAAQIITDLASALDAAHRAGILHRDLKPSNVLIDKNGRALLADFGIARAAQAATRLTTTGSVVGTPGYMAPELAMGEEATPASDRYALAVVAFELLAGSPPFRGETPLAVLHQHVTRPAPAIRSLVPTLPPQADDVFARALAKAPAERPSTSVGFASELQELASDAPASAGPGLAPPTLPLARPRKAVESPSDVEVDGEGRSWRWVAAAAITLAIATAALWLLRSADVVRFTQPAAPAATTGATAGAVDGQEVTTSDEPASDELAAEQALRDDGAPGEDAAPDLTPLRDDGRPAAGPWPPRRRHDDGGPGMRPIRRPPAEMRAADSRRGAAAPGANSQRGANAQRDLDAAADGEPAAAGTEASALPPFGSRLRRFAAQGGSGPRGGPGPAADHPGARSELARLRGRLSEEIFQDMQARAATALEHNSGDALARSLSHYAAGGLAFVHGDLPAARASLLAAQQAGGLPPQLTQLGSLWVLEAGSDPATFAPWELAVAFGDPRRDGLETARQALAAGPATPRLRFAVAYLERLAGQHREAARDAAALYAELPASDPHRAPIAGFVAAEQVELGAYDEALAWYRKAVAVGGQPLAALAFEAARLAEEKLGDTAAAAELFQNACAAGNPLACRRARALGARR